MKHFTLMLALFAFLAVGCAEETEIETPTGEIEYEEDTALEEEMDALGNEIEEGAMEMEQEMEEGAMEMEQEIDEALDGDADGDGM